ncbi:MAG: ribosomal-protein-L7/L12-serine acetyltransferase [Methanoregulaceae archaeon PtaB.Bin056]|nr:MAG: ribosomal-protein-L7/L12-serine acetyltransferase [Methanoregulaceae archaeon PtaB.Bin056]
MCIPDTLTTPRLLLRSFSPDDAPSVQKLADDICIAAGVLEIPHPYMLEDAREWIGEHNSLWQRGEQYIFAITEREATALVGAASLRVNSTHAHAELGYWIGEAFRGRGYATEAAEALLEFGFLGLGLHRIYGRLLAWNTASSNVLTRIGMRYEGTMRGHAWKWGSFHDVHFFGIQSPDFYRRYVERSPGVIHRKGGRN